MAAFFLYTPRLNKQLTFRLVFEKAVNRFIFFLLCAIIFFLPLPLGSYRPWAIMTMGSLICFTFILHLVNSAVNNKPLYPARYSLPLFSALLLVCVICVVQLYTVWDKFGRILYTGSYRILYTGSYRMLQDPIGCYRIL